MVLDLLFWFVKGDSYNVCYSCCVGCLGGGLGSE